VVPSSVPATHGAPDLPTRHYVPTGRTRAPVCPTRRPRGSSAEPARSAHTPPRPPPMPSATSGVRFWAPISHLSTLRPGLRQPRRRLCKNLRPGFARFGRAPTVAALSRTRATPMRGVHSRRPDAAPEDNARRGAAIAARKRAQAEWDAANPGVVYDPELFQREILPRLASVKLSEIARSRSRAPRTATALNLGDLHPTELLVAQPRAFGRPLPWRG